MEEVTEKVKDIKELDYNDLKADQVNTVLYRFMRSENGRDGEGAKVIAKALSNLCNVCGGTDIKALVEESMRDHRTLLQQKMEFVFAMVAAAARMYKEDNVDGRNEYSFKMASDIYDTLSTDDDGKDGKYHKLNMGVPFI